MQKKEGSSIQIYDMNHGYEIKKWRASLSDMRLNLEIGQDNMRINN